jgi:hypothetical protein
MGAVIALGPLTAWPASSAAQDPSPATPGAEDPPVATYPAWRFRKDDRPIKVIVLAGSIGAWPKQPYAERIQQLCANVEVKNLSTVGEGALALKQRFRKQVLENPGTQRGDARFEHWLVFQGGLNSVGTPEMTNHHLRELFVLAHAKGFSVVGLTLTPWGDASDKGSWRGARALESYRNTRKVVDYVLGRLTPADALASYTAKRKVAAPREAAWNADELPDVAVDLFDSGLRDPSRPLGDVAQARAGLLKDARWRRRHAHLGDTARELVALYDAMTLAGIERWWLRPELRSFDHIHPNAEGHRIMAETACPTLPASWGCSCPAAATTGVLAQPSDASAEDEPAPASPAMAPSP